eukprot:6211194-Pleurochrysis_carterae.AAC.6
MGAKGDLRLTSSKEEAITYILTHGTFDARFVCYCSRSAMHACKIYEVIFSSRDEELTAYLLTPSRHPISLHPSAHHYQLRGRSRPQLRAHVLCCPAPPATGSAHRASRRDLTYLQPQIFRQVAVKAAK